MAGWAGGFEPPHGGIKIRCLTAWRRPKGPRGPASAREAGATIVRGLAHRNLPPANAQRLAKRADLAARRLPGVAVLGRCVSRPASPGRAVDTAPDGRGLSLPARGERRIVVGKAAATSSLALRYHADGDLKRAIKADAIVLIL